MWFFRALHAHFDRELSQAILPGRPAYLLDAGCGAGGLIKYLSLKHPEWNYSGLDLAPLACALARERTGANIVQASVEALPYEDASFDAVLSADVLCQVETPALAASESYRILRPGGIALINAPAYPWLYSYHDVHCGNKRRYRAAELRALLSEAGFRGIQITHWNALAFPALWWRRKVMRPRTTTDVEMPSLPVDFCLRCLTRVENLWLEWGGRWGWGSSLFAVARKPLAEEHRVR